MLYPTRLNNTHYSFLLQIWTVVYLNFLTFNQALFIGFDKEAIAVLTRGDSIEGTV